MRKHKKFKNFKRKFKRALCTVLSAAMLSGSGAAAPPVTAQAAATVTVARFNDMLKNVSGADAWTESDAFYGSRAALTNEVAAQMALRADETINGSAYDENLYYQVVSKKCIKDISKAAKTYRRALRICFVKGIMPGKSPAEYSHQRKLSPKSATTPADASAIVSRVASKTKRIKLTADGQVTRTKNLPKNVGQYRYILASFPNSYYEPKFNYQLVNFGAGYIPKNLIDYAAPKDVRKVTDGWHEGFSFGDAYDRYADQWMDTIKKNLELRFNYNYKTTDFNKWKAELLKTFPSRYKDRYSDGLDWWRGLAAEYKVQTKTSAVVVDPSSIYLSDNKYFVRCYVKFKVNASRLFSAESLDQNAYVYSSHMYLPGLQLNKTYSAVIDVPFGDWAVGSYGNGATVVDSYLGRAGDTRKAL